MAHEKVYGICEDKCKVEVYPKEKTYSKDETDTKMETVNDNANTKLSKSAIKSFTTTITGDGTQGFTFKELKVDGFTSNSIVLDVIEAGTHIVQDDGWVHGIDYINSSDGNNVRISFDCQYTSTHSVTVYYLNV